MDFKDLFDALHGFQNPFKIFPIVFCNKYFLSLIESKPIPNFSNINNVQLLAQILEKK